MQTLNAFLKPLTWAIQNHAQLVALAIAIMAALTAIVHGVHLFLLSLAGVAKLTKTKADDDEIAKWDGRVQRAERALAWVQALIPHWGVNIFKLLSLLQGAKATVDGVGPLPASLPPPKVLEQAEHPTLPDTSPQTPSAKRDAGAKS